MDKLYSIEAIAIMAVVTAVLRFLPFAVLGNRKAPALITYLGNVLPYAIMGMLVVYCLKDMRFTSAEDFVPQLAAGLLVVLTYVWKRNTLLSIISGTVFYMLLVQLAFPG